MTVWILTQGEYDDEQVAGAFSTEEKAKDAARAILKSSEADTVSIASFEVDSVTLSFGKWRLYSHIADHYREAI